MDQYKGVAYHAEQHISREKCKILNSRIAAIFLYMKQKKAIRFVSGYLE